MGERDHLAETAPVEQARDVTGRRLRDVLRVLRVPAGSPGLHLIVNPSAVDGLFGRLVGCSHRPSQPSDVRTWTRFPLLTRRKPPLGGPRTGAAERDWDNGCRAWWARPAGEGERVTATDDALDMARVAVAAAADKKAQDIVVLDVSDQLVITDCFVIASAPNERQVQAIVDEVEEKLRLHGAKPTRREGTREGRWVLLDFVDVVVHVQHTEERGFYGLDRLWKDCPRIAFPEAIIDAGPSADTTGPTQ
jgi:ribosome-associated protein